MPFDGVEAPFNYLAKFDQAIELVETPGQWVKHSYRTPDGRYCLKEALNVVGIVEIVEPIILRAAEAVTGREFCCIESFNDHPATTRGDVIAVLHQTRTKILAGTVTLPPIKTTSPVPGWGEPAANQGGWPVLLWQKLFSWS
jgi:hypothetical protein